MTISPVRHYPTKAHEAAQAAWRSSCTRGPRRGNVLLALLCLVAWASAEALEPGRYEIVAHTVMPHLEENLRYATTREQRCLQGEALASVFPILRHPSLEGCALAGERLRYRLVCASPQVATGSARLDERPGHIAGILEIKMGGKNMTFAQRIEAVRLSDCELP